MIATIDPNLESLVMETMIQVIGIIIVIVCLPIVIYKGWLMFKLSYYHRQYNKSMRTGQVSLVIVNGLKYYNELAKRHNYLFGSDKIVKYLINKKWIKVR